MSPPPNNIIYNNIHNTTVINNVINARPAPETRNPAVPNVADRPGRAPSGETRPGGRAGPGPAVVGPALPTAAATRANLIQQGKAPLPPSASVKPAIVPPPAAPGVKLPGPRGPDYADQRATTRERTGRRRKAGPADSECGGAAGHPTSQGERPTSTRGEGCAASCASSPTPPTPAVRAGQPAPSAPALERESPKGNALPMPGNKDAPPPVSQPPKANTLPVPGAKGAPSAPAVSPTPPTPAVRAGQPAPSTPALDREPPKGTPCRCPEIKMRRRHLAENRPLLQHRMSRLRETGADRRPLHRP